jgi:hypothetical protein
LIYAFGPETHTTEKNRNKQPGKELFGKGQATQWQNYTSQIEAAPGAPGFYTFLRKQNSLGMQAFSGTPGLKKNRHGTTVQIAP